MIQIDGSEETPFERAAHAALEDLFERARQKDELNFALSLTMEFKPFELTSAMEAQQAFRDFEKLLAMPELQGESGRVRIAFSFYLYAAESAGVWCIPKALLGALGGGYFNADPFWSQVERRATSQRNVAPNANKVMLSIANAAAELGLDDLARVFVDAFDHELRNAIAHSDYVLNHEGVHISGRHNKQRLISFVEFNRIFQTGLNLYYILAGIVGKYQEMYQSPQVVVGSMNDRDGEGCYVIYSDPVARTMSVSGGVGFTRDTVLDILRRRGVDLPPSTESGPETS